MQDFKQLRVWRKAHEFSLEIYRATRAFPKDELYGLTIQMRRAALSIPANIAEGCGRHSRSELVRFLDIAMGSGSELEYFLLVAHDLGYLSQDGYSAFEPELLEVKRMLNAFIQKVRSEIAADR